MRWNNSNAMVCDELSSCCHFSFNLNKSFWWVHAHSKQCSKKQWKMWILHQKKKKSLSLSYPSRPPCGANRIETSWKIQRYTIGESLILMKCTAGPHHVFAIILCWLTKWHFLPSWHNKGRHNKGGSPSVFVGDDYHSIRHEMHIFL